uniref:Uncharacterized protein n=1 Tax=Octopus bimaculoides TaxID=37653 RepID=A0A0L8ID74_OCTBM
MAVVLLIIVTHNNCCILFLYLLEAISFTVLLLWLKHFILKKVYFEHGFPACIKNLVQGVYDVKLLSLMQIILLVSINTT